MGRFRVFADSNYFIGLFNPEDSLHLRARQVSQILHDKKISIVLSEYNFLEVTTVLSQRAGRKTAIIAGHGLRTNPDTTIVHINEYVHEATWKIFQGIEKKNFSFVDASILAIMEVEDIKSLLTFDRDDFKPLLKKHHFKLFP